MNRLSSEKKNDISELINFYSEEKKQTYTPNNSSVLLTFDDEEFNATPNWTQVSDPAPVEDAQEQEQTIQETTNEFQTLYSNSPLLFRPYLKSSDSDVSYWMPEALRKTANSALITTYDRLESTKERKTQELLEAKQSNQSNIYRLKTDQLSLDKAKNLIEENKKLFSNINFLQLNLSEFQLKLLTGSLVVVGSSIFLLKKRSEKATLQEPDAQKSNEISLNIFNKLKISTIIRWLSQDDK